MTQSADDLKRLAECNEQRSWADYGTVAPSDPRLQQFISSFTYSVGSLVESEEKLIIRAFPSLMTQIYFEFFGGISEIRGEKHGFGGETVVAIEKRTYIKHGLGGWFDIFQRQSDGQIRPIKNLKVDLYPVALFEMFHISPKDLAGEQLQLSDLMGSTMAALMLEEMEAAETGEQLVAVAEQYFLQYLLAQSTRTRLIPDISNQQFSFSKKCIPLLPGAEGSLSQQAEMLNRSERWLQKRYAEVYGITFKQAQSNNRFHQAHQIMVRSLCRRQCINLTELAYNAGYYDQAHFIKDFRRFTGMTPGQYLKQYVSQDEQYLWFW